MKVFYTDNSKVTGEMQLLQDFHKCNKLLITDRFSKFFHGYMALAKPQALQTKLKPEDSI